MKITKKLRVENGILVRPLKGKKIQLNKKSPSIKIKDTELVLAIRRDKKGM